MHSGSLLNANGRLKCVGVCIKGLRFSSRSGAPQTLLWGCSCLIRATFIVQMRVCCMCQFVSLTICHRVCALVHLHWSLKTIQMQINVETAPVLIKTPHFSAAMICLLFILSSVDEWLQSLSSVLLEHWQEGKWKEKSKKRAHSELMTARKRGMLEMFN